MTVLFGLDDGRTIAFDTAESFDEADHPRDDRGRFEDKEGGASSSGTKADVPSGWDRSEPDDPAIAVVYRNSDAEITVSVSKAAAENVSVETQHQVLAQLGAMQQADPTDLYLPVNIVVPAEMARGGRDAGGMTYTNASGGTVIDLNAAHIARTDTPSPSGSTVQKALPDTVSTAQYVVTHEYGHALQAARDYFRDDAKFVRDRGKIIRSEEPPSSYGNYKLTDKDEAYAEAYADWRLNDTPGPLAQALAEHEGWGAR